MLKCYDNIYHNNKVARHYARLAYHPAYNNNNNIIFFYGGGILVKK